MQKAAAVKTKDTYIETQVKTSVTEAPEPQRQGQRAFVREQGRKADAADEASADGAEQTASEYITRSRHFGNDRYSAKCGGSFTQKY